MAVGEENDSGMGSLVQSSKDVTPEKPKSLPEDSDDEVCYFNCNKFNPYLVF